jgi:hypothetical protein
MQKYKMTESQKRATQKAKNRIAELMIKHYNLPEKTADEYWQKCKQLKNENA